MWPVRIRHSSHDFGWQSSHFLDLAGWQAKMAFIKIWIPCTRARVCVCRVRVPKLKQHWTDHPLFFAYITQGSKYKMTFTSKTSRCLFDLAFTFIKSHQSLVTHGQWLTRHAYTVRAMSSRYDWWLLMMMRAWPNSHRGVLEGCTLIFFLLWALCYLMSLVTILMLLHCMQTNKQTNNKHTHTQTNAPRSFEGATAGCLPQSLHDHQTDMHETHAHNALKISTIHL